MSVCAHACLTNVCFSVLMTIEPIAYSISTFSSVACTHVCVCVCVYSVVCVWFPPQPPHSQAAQVNSTISSGPPGGGECRMHPTIRKLSNPSLSPQPSQRTASQHAEPCALLQNLIPAHTHTHTHTPPRAEGSSGATWLM